MPSLRGFVPNLRDFVPNIMVLFNTILKGFVPVSDPKSSFVSYVHILEVFLPTVVGHVFVLLLNVGFFGWLRLVLGWNLLLPVLQAP